jgi:hypothetical protein
MSSTFRSARLEDAYISVVRGLSERPHPVRSDLAVLDSDVLAGDFGNAQLTHRRCDGLDRVAHRRLARLRAHADDLGDAVALIRSFLLVVVIRGGESADRYFRPLFSSQLGVSWRLS